MMNEASEQPRKPEALESWKEIAAHLQRDVKTVQRWEKKEGLPVHRHLHGRRSSVYAYPAELATWRAGRKPEEEEPQPAGFRSWLPGVAAGLTLAAIGWAIVAGPILNPPDSMAEAAGGSLRTELMWPEADRISPQGSVSPDGRYLTYVDWGSGGNLAVRDLEAGDSRLLTTDAGNAGNFAFESRISPDGKFVAYDWSRSSPAGETIDLRLLELNSENGEPRTIFRPVDGETISVQDWFPDGKRVAAKLSAAESERIVAVSVNSGQIQQIRSVEWGVSGAVLVSPDGQFLAYSRAVTRDAPEEDIFVVAVDGSAESTIVGHVADDELLAWSPDGTHVLFNSDRGGQRGLWAQRVHQGRAEGEAFLVMPNMDAGRAGIARDGSLYYPARLWRRRMKIVSLDMQTGKLLEQPRDVAEQRLGSNSRAVFSPDGEKLAYLSGRQRGNPFDESVIVVRTLATGEEKHINHGLRGLWKILWEPASQALTAEQLYGGLYAVDTSTGETRLLAGAQPATLQQTAWAPDGKRIYYRDYSIGDDRRLFALNTEDGSRVTVFENLGGHFPGVSPDGKWLSSVWHGPNDARFAEIRLRSIADGEDRLLWTADAQSKFGVWAVWTPDGEALLVLKHDPDATDRDLRTVWVVPVDGSPAVETELSFRPPMNGYFPLSIHPDGRRVVYSDGNYVQQFWALRNIPFDQWEERAE